MRWRAAVAAIIISASPLAATPARADELAAPPDYAAAVAYMRTLPAETLIRIAWAGTGQADRAVAIARRESHLDCAADNRSSSAAGLFQTLSIHRARAERLGLQWTNVTGPDCLDDCLLAFALWQDQGWKPWSTS